EQEFRKVTAAKGPDMYVALYDYAFELSKQVKPDFTVPSAWRDELYLRLKKKGIDIDRKQYDGAAHYLDRLLENRVARLAFGDSTAKRRELDDDTQLRRALELLRKGQNQKELFTLVAANARH
ncbi:MAG: hypothetical protein ABI877_11695, partial [Gemmatimonadaceae bacterium]